MNDIGDLMKEYAKNKVNVTTKKNAHIKLYSTKWHHHISFASFLSETWPSL